MTKRIIALFISIFAISQSGFSQITQDEYNKLVDYVNCRYLIDYINSKRIEIGKGAFLTDFDKYAKSYSDKVEDYDDIYKGHAGANSTSIYNALKKSSKGRPEAEVLWKHIDNKKARYNSSWDYQQIIDSLVYLPEKIKVNNLPFDLKKLIVSTQDKLSNDLSKLLNDNSSKTALQPSNSEANSEVEVLGGSRSRIAKNEVDSTTFDNKEDAQSTQNGRTKRSYLPLFILVVAIAAIGYILFKYRNKVLSYISKFRTGSKPTTENDLEYYKKRCEDLEREVNRLSYLETNNAALNLQLKQLKLQIQKIENESTKRVQGNSEVYHPIVINDKAEIKRDNQRRVLFADAILSNEFHKTTESPDSDTIFELHLSNSNRTAEFGIYYEAYKRILKNADFVDGCEKQKLTMQPTDLEVENGEAVLGDSGAWRITKKAVIKFI